MDRETAEALVDALDASSGIIAAVGAGGKKSTLHRLLEAHRALGTCRILLSSTVQTTVPPKALDVETLLIEEPTGEQAIASSLGRDGAFFFAAASEKPGRFSGLPKSLIHPLYTHAAFGVGLVKADGARMRMIKAPGDHEPALPGGVATVLPMVSARIFGRPLGERIAHRAERLAEVIGATLGDALSPDHVAKLLSSEDGALRGVGQASVVPVINMVDGPERLALAREAAVKALSLTERFDRVVLTSMTSPSPLVEVITKR